ncbi:hypothetical protein [Edaphobacter sp.]|uniref:hypothetical protein n=1 Tax=Edaphobacter sp. TaxID=1934404 RepID=UPI002DBCEF61|nr:hypothetical protein [Edaphobacter sp.]HEU5341830.1 hypothetical protein [Edaphobacter sp.]
MAVLGVCVLGLAGAVGSASAQTATAPGEPAQGLSVNISPGEDSHTLHVYANLIQIPVLVLGPRLEPVAPIAADRFRVSIDGGPRYKVRHVRLEGDDPISLAIFLDLRGPVDDLMQNIDLAMAELAPLSLHPKDHVSIYGLGCDLERSADDVTVTKAALQGGVDALLKKRMQWKQERPKIECKDEWHLWDTLGFVVQEMSQVPGRRVILVVTNGEDRGSHVQSKLLTQFAQSKGVAVFGIESQTYLHLAGGFQYEDPLDALCQLSGGLVVRATTDTLAEKLVRFVTMVRGRYIVQFPRPYNSTAGSHNLAVTIEKSDDFIRSAGISVPIPDPALMTDPTTVPSDPSLTPQQGKRRILPKN